jgi:hypothetical protein
MTARGLPGLAAYLGTVGSLEAAVAALGDEAVDADRAALVAVFRSDPRRNLLVERYVASAAGVVRQEMAVSIDLLPSAIRRRINEAASFAEFSDGASDFMKLLGLPSLEGASLSARGLRLDGELCGIIALAEPKRRFGTRVLDRVAPATDLFALAFQRLLESDARTEAVRTLENVTRSIHQEYERTVEDLQRRLAAATDSRLNGRGENGRVAELERALTAAMSESHVNASKLTAVDQQVGAAVSRLERAHMELHEQTEITRKQSDLLHTLRLRLETALTAPDVPAAVKDLLQSLRKAE